MQGGGPPTEGPRTSVKSAASLVCVCWRVSGNISAIAGPRWLTRTFFQDVLCMPRTATRSGHNAAPH